MNKKNYYLLFLLLLIMASCSKEKLNFKDIFGINIDTIKKDYEYGDFLSFSGDGYTGLLYSISDTEMNSIIDKISNQKLPIEKESFKRVFWNKTPIIKEEKDVLSLVSSYYSKNTKFFKFQKKIKLLMTNNNNYFSYYYKETEGSIDDIELYLLDTTNNKIYIVRHTI